MSRPRRWVLPTVIERTACEPDRAAPMRWLIVFFLALILFGGLRRWLAKLGLGKLPGDFSLRFFGREFYVPLASSLVLSFVAMLIGRWF